MQGNTSGEVHKIGSVVEIVRLPGHLTMVLEICFRSAEREGELSAVEGVRNEYGLLRSDDVDNFWRIDANLEPENLTLGELLCRSKSCTEPTSETVDQYMRMEFHPNTEKQTHICRKDPRPGTS